MRSSCLILGPKAQRRSPSASTGPCRQRGADSSALPSLTNRRGRGVSHSQRPRGSSTSCAAKRSEVGAAATREAMENLTKTTATVGRTPPQTIGKMTMTAPSLPSKTGQRRSSRRSWGPRAPRRSRWRSDGARTASGASFSTGSLTKRRGRDVSRSRMPRGSSISSAVETTPRGTTENPTTTTTKDGTKMPKKTLKATMTWPPSRKD
mmetsp:Transcript_26029/g.77042  ORF Transcript_26029/g.77042 Transcript_26029/m.77042 type:complete len:207 (+) Transcript_26029:473-1093(+)